MWKPSPGARAAIAQSQAELTHGHPTVADPDLTAAIADLVVGGDPARLPQRLHAYWLGSLWTCPPLAFGARDRTSLMIKMG